MERKIVKSGVYGFIIGLLIGVVIFKDYSAHGLNGSTITEVTYEPMRVYVLKLIRFSAILSLLTMSYSWFRGKFTITNHKTKFLDLLLGFLKAFILGLLIILLTIFISRLLAK